MATRKFRIQRRRYNRLRVTLVNPGWRIPNHGVAYGVGITYATTFRMAPRSWLLVAFMPIRAKLWFQEDLNESTGSNSHKIMLSFKMVNTLWAVQRGGHQPSQVVFEGTA
jgi:hypothetical protein